MTDSENPFVLLARITVKEGMVDDYLEIAAAADKAVEKTEEGMFFHNFDRGPDDKHKIVWTEVYRKSDDFLFHADNPAVLGYIEKHAELATHFSIEIYGNVSNEVIETIKSRKFPFKHFASTSVGYIRSERFA